MTLNVYCARDLIGRADESERERPTTVISLQLKELFDPRPSTLPRTPFIAFTDVEDVRPKVNSTV